MTRFPVCALRSAELDTPDLALSEAFYTGVWGLTVAARTDDAVYLRATGDDHHVLVLRAAPISALRAVVFRTAAEADLADIAARAQVGTIMPPVPQDPAGGVSVALRGPDGLVLRFVHGDARNARGVSIANLPLRLAHVNINSTDVDATSDFLWRRWGFIWRTGRS